MNFSHLVSSRLGFIDQNPSYQVSHVEVEHELKHLKVREQLSSVAALAGLVLSMVAMAGIFGGGMIVLGALFAITGLAAGYAYCCRLAETDLRAHQMNGIVSGKFPPKGYAPSKGAGSSVSDKLLGFFSNTAT